MRGGVGSVNSGSSSCGPGRAWQNLWSSKSSLLVSSYSFARALQKRGGPPPSCFGLGLERQPGFLARFFCDQMQEDSILTIQNPIEIKARFGCTFIIFQFLFS